MYRTALLFVAVLVCPCASTRLSAQQPSQPAVPHDSVRGAIRAIDVRARTLDVSSGVGYALRVVHLQLPTSIQIADRAASSTQPDSIGLAQLKLGDVVRAQFGGYREPFVVYTIERVGSITTGVKPTP